MGNDKALSSAPESARAANQSRPAAGRGRAGRALTSRIDIDFLYFDDQPVAAIVPSTSQGERFRSLLNKINMLRSDDLHDDPCIVIAPAIESAVHHLHEIRQQCEASGGNPLTVVIVQNPTAALADQVDLLLPWGAEWCEYHLRAALKGRIAQQTEHFDAETARNELELIKTAIVHNISHELNTPLLQIKSAVNQIERAIVDDPYLAQLSDYANQAVGRLEGLVSRVVRIARGIEIRPEPTLPTDVLNLALRQLRNSWEHRASIDRVQTLLAPDLPLIFGDKQALGVLLEQLIDNALKFSDGSVDVVVGLDPGGVRFAVIDSGIGIAAGERDRIFDLFYQSDSGSTRRVGGAGIGLAIAERIAVRHGTIIEVSSEVGQGSAFSFVLPLLTAH